MVGGVPSQVWMVGGTPARSGWLGWYLGYPPPARSGWGTPPPQTISIASTCYAADGMPLAFTQEDFLVHANVGSELD